MTEIIQPTSPFIQEFKNVEDIARAYSTTAWLSSLGQDVPVDVGKILETLRGAKIYLAWYGYGSYCGSSLVIYEKDGKLYEVNGGHCSCNGLEGQWEPEETSWEALDKRNYSNIDTDCDGGNIADALFHELVNAHKS